MQSNRLVLSILDYIDKNIYTKITIDELSNIFYYNKDYIMRLFKKEIGTTIIDYINNVRIYNSMNDLIKTDDKILKIAINHGFISQEYFSEIFKKVMGVSPITFRKFSKYDISISDDVIMIIRDNMVDLKIMINDINKYKNNIPKENVKKLSLYK